MFLPITLLISHSTVKDSYSKATGLAESLQTPLWKFDRKGCEGIVSSALSHGDYCSVTVLNFRGQPYVKGTRIDRGSTGLLRTLNSVRTQKFQVNIMYNNQSIGRVVVESISPDLFYHSYSGFILSLLFILTVQFFKIIESRREVISLLSKEKQSNLEIRSLSNEVMKIQNRERINLANIVHDEICQSLTAMQYLVDLMVRKNAPVSGDDLNNFKSLISAVSKSSRGILGELNPDLLHSNDLESAIRSSLSEIFSQSEICFSVTVEGDPIQIPERNLHFLYRSAVECCRNSLKHSMGDKVQVCIRFYKDEISVTVQDNGVGIDDTEIVFEKGRRGYGLFSIRIMSESLGGKFSITNTSPGICAKISVSVINH